MTGQPFNATVSGTYWIAANVAQGRDPDLGGLLDPGVSPFLALLFALCGQGGHLFIRRSFGMTSQRCILTGPAVR